MRKFLLIIVIAIGAGFFWLGDASWLSTSGGRFSDLWAKDVENLVAQNKLPEAWSKLREIEYIAASDEAKKWLEGAKPKFSVSAVGTHKLEVLVDDWVDGTDSGAVIQYNLVDLSSGNTVWELGRTLTLVKKPH